MENSKFANDLFSDSGDSPIIPNNESNKLDNSTEQLMSKDVAPEISKEVVSNVLIPNKSNIELPNYVLDFRYAKTLKEYQINALNNLIEQNGGTVSIYVLLNNGLEKIGNGDVNKLRSLLEVGVRSLFNGQCKVYQNYEQGKPVHELKGADPSSIILNI